MIYSLARESLILVLCFKCWTELQYSKIRLVKSSTDAVQRQKVLDRQGKYSNKY